MRIFAACQNQRKLLIAMSEISEMFKSMIDPIIKESIQKNIHSEMHETSVQTLPESLTQDQASNYLGISKSALYAMTSKNEIAYHKKGRRNYFKKTDLRNWIESGRVRPLSEIREQMR